MTWLLLVCFSLVAAIGFQVVLEFRRCRESFEALDELFVQNRRDINRLTSELLQLKKQVAAKSGSLHVISNAGGDYARYS